MLAVWFEVRVSLALGTTLNNQQAVLAPGIVRLVPLGFLPSDKTGFVGPIPWIWRAVFVKLISPPDPRNWTNETGFVRGKESQWYQSDNARCQNGQFRG